MNANRKNQIGHEDHSHDIVIDPSAENRETFIPLRHIDLLRKLKESFDIVGADAKYAANVFDSLQTIFHAEHFSLLINLEDSYEPIDPDSEAIHFGETTVAELDQQTESFFDRLSDLLFSAHYQTISRDELERAIGLSSNLGIKLKVNFDVFNRLEIFARGYRMVDVEQRNWRTWFKTVTVQLPEFKRLVLAFRLNDSDTQQKDGLRSDVVYLKIFKNIPETDLEALLPGSEVKLSTLDRGKSLLPTVTGAYNIYKYGSLVRGLLLLGFATAVEPIWGILLLLVAVAAYGFKSFLSLKSTKSKYQFDLTRNLYLKNLDNNAGVLYRILNEAQEQELCEAVLGYAVLWQMGGETGLTETELDEKAEEFLAVTTHRNVDFEVHDALAKLTRLGLADVDADGRWNATPIDRAPTALQQSWQRLYKSRFKHFDPEAES